MNNNLELKLKAKKIKLVAFDVDGVMTDGSLTFDENGVEYKTFNAKRRSGNCHAQSTRGLIQL
ncbi:MAG: hypothetical protein L6V95_10870 [Candidatus Melainabacteria bacterium]|nr:MAG: hypothetical protein L6V95_10870 [Candidatus Melainabacteria bacterium]